MSLWDELTSKRYCPTCKHIATTPQGSPFCKSHDKLLLPNFYKTQSCNDYEKGVTVMDEKKLYHFLMTHETGIAKINGKPAAWVHVDFNEIGEFTGIIGADVMCEGYVKATIMQSSVVVELIDSVLFDGEVEEYKDCFDKDDWERAWRDNDDG